jgi:predicted AlkP superfamily phosphohydrolase/phosphomutase
VLLVSDHGSGPLLGSVYLNKLFMQHGLLAIRNHPLTTLKTWLARTRIIERLYGLLRAIGIDPRPLFSKQVRQAAVQSGLGTQDIDWARTKAFVSGDFGQVSLNIAGREPQGIVDPRDKESLLDEVITLLDSLTDEQGNPIIQDVWRAPSLYQGPYLESAPDLEFSFKDFTYKAALGMAMGHKDIVERVRYARGEVSGGHSLHGIFYAKGPGIKQGAAIDGLEMSQVAPLVLYSMGIAIPAQMDGKLPESFFDPGYLADHPAQSSDDDLQGPSAPGSEGYNAEELEQVESRLRGLGYLE